MALLLFKKSIMTKLQKPTHLFCFPSSKGIGRAFSSSGGRWRSNDELRDMFESFIVKYERHYDTPEEKENRFRIFKERIKLMDYHNFTYAHGLPVQQRLSWRPSLPDLSDFDLDQDPDNTDRTTSIQEKKRADRSKDQGIGRALSFSTTSSSTGGRWRSDDEVRDMFESFIVEYERHYDTPEEKEKRFRIFKGTIRFIDHHNATHTDPFDRVGITSLADIDIEDELGFDWMLPPEDMDWIRTLPIQQRPQGTSLPDLSEIDLYQDPGIGRDLSFSTTSGTSGGRWRSDDEVRDMFESFIVEHERHYDTPEEKEKRFRIFKGRIRFIDHHNATHTGPFDRVGITSLADIDIEDELGFDWMLSPIQQRPQGTSLPDPSDFDLDQDPGLVI